MIGRRGKLLILLYVVFLAVLFLMCSTDLIIREPERDVYQIAVIIEDSRDDNYVNFRKGMDQAAMEFQADVHFITLYEKMDADQQMELILREQQDGADALIIVPADEDRVVSALAQGQVFVPAVLLGTGLSGQGVAGTIAPDYKEMGELLAQEIAAHEGRDCQVLIFEDPGKHSAMSRLFLEGAKDAFDSMGCRWKSVFFMENGRGAEDMFQDLAGERGDRTAILAQNPEILTETAAILSEIPGFEGSLYGRGSTLGILNYLDRGRIGGICVTDQFGAGYLSVETAVRALEEGGSQGREELDVWYIDKEDLRRPEYEKLLYPVE